MLIGNEMRDYSIADARHKRAMCMQTNTLNMLVSTNTDRKKIQN